MSDCAYCIYGLLFYKLQSRQFTMFSVGYPLMLVAIITTDVSSRIQGCWKVTERLNCGIINYTRRLKTYIFHLELTRFNIVTDSLRDGVGPHEVSK